MGTFNEKEIGKRIRNAREKLNLSQYQLYEKTGISTTQISAYENGKKCIGLQSLAKIASALNLSLDDLYYGTASHKPISSSVNNGELIVNCVHALYEQGVICALIRHVPDEYVGQGAEWYYRIGFGNYVGILDDLVKKLNSFDVDKKNYPDPDGFKKQLLAAAINQINAMQKSKDK